MMSPETFFICWSFLAQFFGPDPDQLSASMRRRVAKQIPRKLEICTQIVNQAHNMSIDPLLTLSVAYHESRLRDLVSPKGARGPLQVIPKYWCSSRKKCNYVKAGVKALATFIDLNPNNLCKALAQYNRGFTGRCSKGRSEYYYAKRVLKMYEDLYQDIYGDILNPAEIASDLEKGH